MTSILRRLLPYGMLAILAAACYTGWTLYSRHRDFQAAGQNAAARAKARQSAANKSIVEQYGGGELTILSFAAEPSRTTPSGKVLLCYGVNNAVRVSIAPDAGPLHPALTHCLDVFPKATTTYVLTAADAQGHEKSASLTVHVQ